MSIQSIQSALDVLRDSAPIIPVPNKARMFFLSDIHMGTKDGADDFDRSGHEKLFLDTIKDYFKKGYRINFGGDIEDLWENGDRKEIMISHPEIFITLQHIVTKRRIIGNHDGDLSFPAGMKFVFNDGRYVLWTHGHKGDWTCDIGSWLGKAFVRYLWAGIGQRLFRMADPTMARQDANPNKHLEVRQAVNEWANRQESKMIALIWGHTHFQERSGRACNDGSWIGPRGGEAVELIGQDLILKTFN